MQDTDRRQTRIIRQREQQKQAVNPLRRGRAPQRSEPPLRLKSEIRPESTRAAFNWDSTRSCCMLELHWHGWGLGRDAVDLLAQHSTEEAVKAAVR